MAVYSKSLSKDEILGAIKKGNSFITNGPLVDFKLNGKIPGEAIDANDNTIEMILNLFDNRGLLKCTVIHNGVLYKEFNFSDGGYSSSYFVH